MSAPIYYKYDLPSDREKQLLLDVTSQDNSCAQVSIQRAKVGTILLYKISHAFVDERIILFLFLKNFVFICYRTLNLFYNIYGEIYIDGLTA